MIAVVLADTHIPARVKKIPEELLPFLREASLILHAGDATEWWVIEELSRFASVYMVRGNMDSLEVSSRLPEKTVVEIERVRLGLIHGLGSPEEAKRMALSAFKTESVQAVVYGHSHRPLLEWHKDFLLMNPGSPTDDVFAPCRTFGRLEICGERIFRAEIIRIE
ncbi:MAG: metallophosphoesterase family protein [Candidatus Caldatribacteriaceae bacterium]